MVDIDTLEQLKMVTGENDNSMLTAYYELAENVVLNRVYPFEEDPTALPLPNRYKSNTFEIAVFLLNKRGAEGQTMHNENGIYRNYENADIPSSMLSRIIPHCGVVK